MCTVISIGDSSVSVYIINTYSLSLSCPPLSVSLTHMHTQLIYKMKEWGDVSAVIAHIDFPEPPNYIPPNKK